MYPVLAIFTLCLPFISLATAQEAASRLRVLLVVDTDAPDVGAAVAVDCNRLTTVFEQAFAGHEHRLTLDVLSGGNVTPDNVLNYYRNLDTDANESLLFFYSGHGGIDFHTREHYLTTRRGSLGRSTLRAAMEAKGARLTILLTNCCSNYGNIPAVSAQNAPSAQQAPHQPDWTALYQLLLQQRGTVDVTAAEPGVIGWGNMLGSCFTVAAIQKLTAPVSQLDIDGNRFVEWGEFFAHVRYQTNEEFQKIKANSQGSNQPITQESQYAYAYKLLDLDRVPQPQAVRQYRKTVLLRNATGQRTAMAIRYLGLNSAGHWIWFPEDGSWLYYDLAAGAEVYPYYGAYPISAYRIEFAARTESGGDAPARTIQLVGPEGYESPQLQTIPVRVHR
jgi:hypothetical protein